MKNFFALLLLVSALPGQPAQARNTVASLAPQQRHRHTTGPDASLAASTRPVLVRWQASRRGNEKAAPHGREFSGDYAGYPAYVRDYKGFWVNLSHYTVLPGSQTGGTAPQPARRTPPTIGAPAALRQALNFVGAQRYMWEDSLAETRLQRQQDNLNATYRPAGELVTVYHPSTNVPVLAWKFDIQALQPLRRSYVYVDAHTGQVVLQEPILELAGADSLLPPSQR